MENKISIYEKDNDFKSIYTDDMLVSCINGTIRILLANSSLPFPTKCINENGNTTIELSNGNDVIVKHLKGEIIIPIENIPGLITGLQQTYDNAKKNKKEE